MKTHNANLPLFLKKTNRNYLSENSHNNSKLKISNSLSKIYINNIINRL